MPAAKNAERRKVTPPQLSREWGVSINKVLDFIHCGELRAVNFAKSDCHRPRYLIDRADIEAFETARQVVPPAPKPVRRRRKPAGIKEYF